MNALRFALSARRPLASPRGVAAFFISVLIALVAPARAAGDGTVTGVVTASDSHVALAAVVVKIDGTDLATATARDGGYTFRNVPAGEQTLSFHYVGLPEKRVGVTVSAGAAARLDVQLGDDVTQLAAMTIEGSRTGQARALNQQRVAQNISNVISSDLTGQFPDKTIADAVKRLPGVTVETDTDTGGAEGRYITIRGMSAAFNAVSINGVRVAIANADDTISRQVPLDVISAKSADTIVVTKSLRPDQDGDSIGGAVDIETRSALDRDGPSAFVEAALGYRHILEGYENYRYSNPNYEGAFSYSDVLGKDRKWALEVSGNARALTSQKQRASVYDWIDISETDTPQYLLEGFILQDFFDHLTNSGASAALDFRPNDDHKFRLTAAYNLRDTVRGRQRQIIWFDDSLDLSDTTPVLTGDTYTHIGTTDNSFTREVREFHEKQSNLNLALSGESRLDGVTLTYLAGYNRGQYKGDPDRDIWARFETRSDFGSTNTYTIEPGNAYFPTITTSENPQDPSLYVLRSLDLSTDVITDDEANLGLDAKFDREIAGQPGFIKVGAKARLRGRDRDHTDRYYLRNRDWSITGYDGDASIPSLVADYRATGLVDGHYDYGFYLDPGLTRRTALTLIEKGLLESDGESDFNSRLYSYSADEDVLAAYVMSQVQVGKFTAMGGLRAEHTRVKFDTYRSVIDADGNQAAMPEPVTASHDYTNLMPGLHLRYDFTPRVSVRAAYTHTISRPTFSDLNPREFLDREYLEISRGRIDLKPVSSDNLDLAFDYYLGSVGYVSAAVFYKKLKNNIYTPDGIETVIDGDTYTISEPRNADGGHVAGIELGYEQQFRFLPAPFDGLGISANWTHADSEVKTGLAEVPESQLFDQVKDTVNAGVFYEKGPWRARVAWLYRSSTVPADYGINQTHPSLGRIIAGGTTLDLTASYRFARQWTVFVELQNLLNTPGRAYDGNESLRLDYNEYTDWSGQLGIRWNL